ncbi:BA14K family protein [Bartonella bilalgolemii]|uniref:Lectin-like protein BA14k n=1 Tax=Bartonella bilalgolemii TaxID=2942911 RepID=A0ABT0P797_9HYPH|nr:BA14K family protein [Bartonella sp. G70]MCL6229338.1 BA14K family protein [Bartonella sp. G70]
MIKLTKLIALSAMLTTAISAPLETVLAAAQTQSYQQTITRTTGGTGRTPLQFSSQTFTAQRNFEYTEQNIHERHVSRSSSSSGNVGGVIAAGLLALTAGIIIKNALKEPEQPQVVYQTPPPNQTVYQVQPTVTYQPAQPLNTTSWYQYCKKTYRSFNPKTGTFRGHDGLDHVCYAPLQ